MKAENITIDMKVTPFQKTAKGWESDIEQYYAYGNGEFLKENGYLYIKEYDDYEEAWILGDKSDDEGGDYFNAEDFKPYEFDKNSEIVNAFKKCGIVIKNEDGTFRNYNDVKKELEDLWNKLELSQ